MTIEDGERKHTWKRRNSPRTKRVVRRLQTQRLRRAPSGAETHSDGVPDEVLGLSQVLNELDGTGARRADYVLGPDGRIAILDGDENERYDLFDALGSVLAVGGPRMGSGSVSEGDGALTTVSGNEQGTPGRWNSPTRQV
jgi:hypothetical protein